MGKAARRRAAAQRALVQSEQHDGGLTADDEVALRDASRAAFAQFSRGLEDLEASSGRSKVRSPYAQITTVFRGIKLIADAMKRVPFELWRDDEPVIDHPLNEFFRRPNPAMGWGKFLATLIVQWHSGNAYMRLGPRNSLGVPTSMDLIPPMRVKPEREPGADVADPNSLRRWKVEMGQGNKPNFIEPEDMIRFEYSPGDDPHVGLSPFEPARLAIDTEYAAAVYQKAMLSNGGTPGSILSYKGSATIPKARRKQLEAEWQMKFGPASRAAKVALLTGDWAYQNLGFTPRDMQYLNLRNFTIGEFARMLNIPPLYLAFFETSGLSDAGLKVQERMFYNQCIIPLASDLAMLLNEYIIRPIDPTLEGVFNFDNVEALRADMGAKMVVAEALDRMNVPFVAINDLLDIGVDVNKYPWLLEKLVQPGLTTARVAVESASLPEPEPAPVPPQLAEANEQVKTIAEIAEGAENEDAAEGDRITENQGARTDELDELGQNAYARQVADETFDAMLDSALRDVARGMNDVATRAVGKLNAKQRAAAVKAVTKAGTPVANKMERQVRGVLRKQKTAVRDALLERAGVSKRSLLARRIGAHGRAVGEDPLDLSPRDIEDILGLIRSGTVAGEIKPTMAEAYRAGVASLRDVLNSMGVTNADFTDFQKNRLPQLVDGYVDARLGTGLPTAVDDTTRALVNSVIITNLETGGTLSDTIKGINAVFNSSLSRARTIARTETTAALNGGRFETMRDEQRVSHHMWITAGDRHVRGMESDDEYSHVKLHGRIVPVGESFARDDDLKFPGDPDAAAANSINCRCTTAPVSERRLSETSDSAIGPTATRVA